jgi:hypothetical protein
VCHFLLCVFVFVSDVLIRQVYRGAAVQMQRIDSISISPVFSMFSETVGTYFCLPWSPVIGSLVSWSFGSRMLPYPFDMLLCVHCSLPPSSCTGGLESVRAFRLLTVLTRRFER